MTTEPPPTGNAPPQYSPDGRWWWNGQNWTPAAPPAPGRPAWQQGGWSPTIRTQPSTGLIVAAVVGAVALLVIGSFGVGFWYFTSHPLESKSVNPRVVTASRGAVVFSDDFHDPSSGWPTLPLASGTTFSYSDGHYVVMAKGTLHHFAYAPYSEPVEAMSASVTADQSAGAAEGTGFGVMCRRAGLGSQQIDYELILLTTGTYYLEVRIGPVSAQTPPDILKEGTAPASPGPSPHTVEGVCLTEASGKTTDLIMFVDGARVAETSDTENLGGSGWNAAIDVVSRDPATSTVSASSFVERNLEH